MTNFEFLEIFYNNIGYFYITILLLAFSFYFVFKKIINSVVDPSFVAFITLVCADSVVFFLWYFSYISLDKFLFVVFSEFLFCFMFSIFYHKKSIVYYKFNSFNSSDERMIFKLFFFYVIIVNIICFSIGGIPLFAESRFSARQIPIVGILNRTLALPTMYCWIYLFHSLKYKCLNIIYILICFFILVLFSLALGSKGFFVRVLYCYFFYSFLFHSYVPKIKLIYLLPIVISPLIVISLYYGNNDFLSGLNFLLFRFVASGDGYWMGFCYDVIDYIDNSALWYERVFSFILGPLHLISDNAKIPIGSLILNVINPGTIGLIEGPNSRIPIFSYACLGWYGLLLSAVFGFLFAKFLNSSFLHSGKSIAFVSILAVNYLNTFSMITDPTIFLSGLLDLVFGIVVINILSKHFFHGRGFINIKL